MRKKHPINRSMRKEYSTALYAIRAKKDSCLYNDAEDFLAKHGGRVDALVGKLLDGDFASSRYTDHSYPF